MTALTALTVFGGCAAARRYLHRHPADSHHPKAKYWGGWVHLTAHWNQGAAFNLPIPAQALPLASAAALGLLWAAGRRQNTLGLGLILGGGLSNLYERVRYGRVYDYVQFPKAPGPLRRYVFNFADFAILGGCVMLLCGKER